MNNEYFPNTYPVFTNLLQAIDQNDLKSFGNILSNIMNNKQLLNLLFFYCNKDEIFRPIFISILIKFGLEPNIILEDPYKYINIKNKHNLDMNNNYNFRIGKSLLMLLCEKSNFSLIKELCELNNKNIKPLNVNYYDKNGRNALFYLRGGKDDIQILDLLIKKGIDINKKDKDENNALHILILKTNNIKLICNLIEEGGANFMIKNKQGKTGLDLINEKYIQRINYNNIINDFKDIRPLIKLLKKKLSIKLYPSNKLIDNNFELDKNSNYNTFNNNNLIKLSSLSTSSTTSNSDSSIENCHNIYVKFNPLSLIVDTQFNDYKNISSSSKKLEYTQMNNNKKYLLNLLKQSENNIKNMKILIEGEIKSKKEILKTLQKNIKDKENNLNEMNNNFEKKINDAKNELNEAKNILEEKKQILLKEKGDNLYAINQNQNYLYKYTPMITQNLKNEYIYNQLQIDLMDFMAYVHKKNEKLQPILTKLNDLIQESVKNSLGQDYHLKMYGSRSTKLCLPWSDIDYVISYNNGKIIFEPLKILYDYLLGLNDKFYSDIKYIANATIPVLKIFSNNEYHKISLDISLENPDHHGEECVNYIKQKIIEYEVLTPLTFALKTILQKAFLNDPYKGGLSSYGVILLIIHFLNIQQKKGNDISIKSLGKLFYDILYYYGNEYDITNPIIVENEKNIQKIVTIHQFQLMRGEFILIDPLNISNNVARNTRQYQNIKLAFRIGYASIKESCECGCHYQYDEINIKEGECEHNLLNRIFNDVKRDII